MVKVAIMQMEPSYQNLNLARISFLVGNFELLIVQYLLMTQ